MNIQNKKKLVLITVLYFILTNLYASPPLVEIKTEFILQNVEWHGGGVNLAFKNNKIFFSQAVSCTIVDMSNLSIREIDRNKEFWQIMGEQNDKLIVKRMGEEKFDRGYFLYDPVNDSYNELSFNPGILFGYEPKYLNSYYGSNYFVTKEDEELLTRLVDIENNDVLTIGSYVSDISEDKQNILIIYNGISVYNLHTKTRFKLTEESIPRYDYSNVYFISNELVLFRRSLIHNVYSVFNVHGKEVLRFQYVHPKAETGITFFKIKDSNYGYYFGVDIVKAIGEMDALRDFGLLFTPTTATANDSRVRIRNYAILEADTLGYLNAGDKLEVLDRSGVKVKIGDMEDYWYKIRRISDGIEGWSYGYFLDLDDPPVVEPDPNDIKNYRILDYDPTIPVSVK